VIYCDGIHLVGTDIDELHRFAQQIGLKHSWFQNHPTHPHYDILSRLIRKAAFEHGARSVTPREIVQLMLSGKLCKGTALQIEKRIESAAQECGLDDAWAAIRRQMNSRRKASSPTRYYLVARDPATGKFIRFGNV
jgi:hypothetical protein